MHGVKLQEAMQKSTGICVEQCPELTQGCEVVEIQPERKDLTGHLEHSIETLKGLRLSSKG